MNASDLRGAEAAPDLERSVYQRYAQAAHSKEDLERAVRAFTETRREVAQ